MAKKGDLRIEVVQGILSKYKVDVIVNSTNIYLELEVGAVSKTLLDRAGDALQEECVQRYPKGIELGKIAVTDGYKLPCKKVYHGALPLYNSKKKHVKPKEILCETVCACLEQAHADGARSIAFPTLGCGFLNYPHAEVAATVRECIAIFKNLHKKTSLTNIYIVIYAKGQDWRHIKQAFVHELGEAKVDDGRKAVVARANSLSEDEVGATRAGLLGKRVLRSHAKKEQPANKKKKGAEAVKDEPAPGPSGEPKPGPSGEPKPGPSGILKRGSTLQRGVSLKRVATFNADEDKVDGPPPLKKPWSLKAMDTCMREQAHNSCKKKLPCGHACPGVKDEKSCPPCIQDGCPGVGAFKQVATDDCTVCYTDVLSAAPVIQLTCSHMYHSHCVKRILDNKWAGARITFNFMKCPMCKEPIEHCLLDEQLIPLQTLKEEVRQKAMLRLEFEGMYGCDQLTSPGAKYFGKPDEFAMDRYCYYHCFNCGKAYFGGVVQCEHEAAERDFEANDLLCPTCSNTDPKQLTCGHVYHFHCVKRMLDNKWVGTRITFNFMKCPMCKQNMEHPLLEDKLSELQALKDEVQRKATLRLQFEGLDKCEDVTSPDFEYFEKPEQFAMDRYCYYPCFDCEKTYFGGVVDCEQGAAEQDFEPEDLKCPQCSNPDPKQLTCGHIYHFHCVKRMLDNKWVGARITFNFMKCPMCKQNMEHPLLEDKLTEPQALKDEVQRKATLRLQFEGLDKCEDITSPGFEYFEKPEQFAMDRYCYYPCFDCKKAYFGGVVDCEQGAAEQEFEPEDLKCPQCSNPDPKQKCDIHGDDFLEYKCRYCCTLAIYFCFGNTHYCEDCHRDPMRIRNAPVKKLPKCPAGPKMTKLKGKQCPLNVKHPPTGTEFSLGCGLCKSEESF